MHHNLNTLQMSIRNIAIIAHVDHGKTTLVDKIIQQANVFQKDKDKDDQELILDNNDLERERGITILSKNISVIYKGVKINIIDTPGHADFGGEVERVLNMADGVLLLVDAFEGPMPQTRFVLEKALKLKLKPLVVVNKVDKPNCDPEYTLEKVFDLFMNLDADNEQLEFEAIYGSSKYGWMSKDWQDQTEDLTALLDTIIDYMPEAPYHEGTVQMQVTNIDFSSYTGRIAIGRVVRGTLKAGDRISLVKRDGALSKSTVKELYVFDGLGKRRVEEVRCGDICAVVGIEGFEIGDTIADLETPEALPSIEVDEPTMNMLFTINNSPFFGKEGKFVTSRHLRDRLYKETEKNLALRIEETDSPDRLMVHGRGILHLSVLIETMRREGYELQVGQPQVLIKEIDGQKHEPIEELIIDVPEEYSGQVIELVSKKKGELKAMEPKGDFVHHEFVIPSRGLIGLRNNLLTASAGNAIIAHRFHSYAPFKGEIGGRNNGVLIALEEGTSIPFAIDKLQDRGFFFIDPGEKVYKGQIVGQHNRHNDLVVNVTKTKKLTNMRASGSDNNAKIAPKVDMSLEECLEYINKDEYVEVTPQNIRMRKINLNQK